MKNFVNKIYSVFSLKLARWFILIGFICLAAYEFFSFLSGLTIEGLQGAAAYYTVNLIIGAAVVVGLFLGYYKGKEPVLIVSFITYLVLRVSGAMFFDRMIILYDGAPATLFLYWIFCLFFALAIIAFTVFAILVFLFKLQKVKLGVQISYLCVLFFGFLAWIFSIVFAANGGGWGYALFPLFLCGSFLFVPGILEEIFPGELEDAAPKAEPQPEEKSE